MLFIRAVKPCPSERLLATVERGGLGLATDLSSPVFLADELWLMALCFPVPSDTSSPFDLESMLRHLPTPELAQLFVRAQHERLLPLLSWKLEHPDGWPFSIRSQILDLPDALRQDARTALRRRRKYAMIQEALLHDVALHLQALQTSAILYKGAAYERLLYPDIGLRPMIDVDIIVPQAHYLALCSRLEQHGYQSLQQHPHERSFRHPPTTAILDVHVALSPEQEGRFDAAALFPLATPLAMGSPWLLLPPEVLLVLHLFHLRGNGMNPNESSLLSIVDLLLLVQKAANERVALWEYARRWRSMALLRLADALLQELWLVSPWKMAPPPASPWEFLQRAALPRVLSSLRQTKHHANDPNTTFQSPQDRALRSLLRFFCYDTLPDMFRSQTAKIARLTSQMLKRGGSRRGV